jgi:hypothetical protein
VRLPHNAWVLGSSDQAIGIGIGTIGKQAIGTGIEIRVGIGTIGKQPIRRLSD